MGARISRLKVRLFLPGELLNYLYKLAQLHPENIYRSGAAIARGAGSSPGMQESVSLLQARGLSWGWSHHGWVPSPSGEDLLGDDFTFVGLTRNPGLSPSSTSWKLVVCYQKKKPQTKKTF